MNAGLWKLAQQELFLFYDGLLLQGVLEEIQMPHFGDAGLSLGNGKHIRDHFCSWLKTYERLVPTPEPVAHEVHFFDPA